jgi:predicted membrane protein
MTDTVSPSPLRERIKDLNTKAYYLLVALSFIYRTSSESHLLKWALTLVAISAVFPVLDYVKSTYLLEIIRAMKVIFMTVALIFTLCWIWTA